MDNEKMNLWRQRIAKCQKSNLTVTEWCAQHQLSKGTYYYWYKKIVQQDDPEKNIPVFADATPVLIKEASVSSTDLTWLLYLSASFEAYVEQFYIRCYPYHFGVWRN